jgi:hypothetical protein
LIDHDNTSRRKLVELSHHPNLFNTLATSSLAWESFSMASMAPARRYSGAIASKDHVFTITNEQVLVVRQKNPCVACFFPAEKTRKGGKPA